MAFGKRTAGSAPPPYTPPAVELDAQDVPNVRTRVANPGCFPAATLTALAPLLRTAMQSGRVSAALYSGAWTDVGTPERLALLNAPPTAP